MFLTDKYFTRQFGRLRRFVAWAGVGFVATAWSSEIAKPTVSFLNDVVPVLTKAGCNSGGCHGKAGGRNGFRLSLFGFEPADDYEQLVNESRGRRLFVSAPERSLLLQKPSGQRAHGGGVRLAPTSEGYATIRDWIRQGTPLDKPSTPKLTALEVRPGKVSSKPNSVQQLAAIARFSDGSIRDVTRLAVYESNDSAMAEVGENGLVKILDLCGNVSIMVRYQDRMAVHRASIPFAATSQKMPVPRNFVDEQVFANLESLGISPSPICDDATFLRRVTLDIAGRLPTEIEAKAFLASKDEGKRDKAVDELLRSGDYADYFANKWTALLKNRRDESVDIASNFAFHAWVRDSLLTNKPYDRFARELLAATGTVIGNPPVAWYKRVKDPKQQIEDVAQLFLGVRIQCAQCHHHPFERWSQDDYYSLAAFFSRVGRKASMIRGEDLIFHQRGSATAKNAKTGVPLKPRALGDVVPEITADEDPRLRLAEWMSGRNNPFFAKALVNRYWKHFFGRGLIEPEDDIRDTNPATNPALLESLEKHFVASGYDLKALVRVIACSRTYQLSEAPTEKNRSDQQNYSHFYPRRLQAEVLLDAIDRLLETQTEFANLPPGTSAVALPDNSYNASSPFLRVFGRPGGESVCECERVQSSSLAQSLHLLNSPDIKSKLASPGGRAQRLANDARPVDVKVRELYLAAFAREPRPTELKSAVEYLSISDDAPAGKAKLAYKPGSDAYQDVIWALVNSKEFLFNH